MHASYALLNHCVNRLLSLYGTIYQCEQLTDRGITTSLTTLQQLQTLNLG